MWWRDGVVPSSKVERVLWMISVVVDQASSWKMQSTRSRPSSAVIDGLLLQKSNGTSTMLFVIPRNSRQNYPKPARLPQNLRQMGAQVVDWRTHRESNGCRPRLSLMLPWHWREFHELDCHWGWEIGSPFYPQDEKRFTTMDQKRWWASGESQMWKVSGKGPSYGVLG